MAKKMETLPKFRKTFFMRVTEAEARILWSLRSGSTPDIPRLKGFFESLEQFGTPIDEDLIGEARIKFCSHGLPRYDHNDVDDDAVTSDGDDGTWVQGWLLVEKPLTDEEEDDEEATPGDLAGPAVPDRTA